jgi:RNA polymerase sigma-70 factor (ECF subfamily)
MKPQGHAGEGNNVDLDWEAVYSELLPRVYNFFRYRVGDGLQAEDLTATTFEKAWRSRQSYRRNLAAFSTWVFAIAHNTATDYYRKQNRQVPLETVRDQVTFDSPDATALMKGDLDHLNYLLSQLPARERELVALKYGADMTNREIA